MEMNENEIIIVDEDGVEVKYQILFTFENEDRGCQYVLYYDPNDPDEVYAAKYNDNHEIFEVEDDAEWEEIQEVFNTFLEDPMIQDAINDEE